MTISESVKRAFLLSFSLSRWPSDVSWGKTRREKSKFMEEKIFMVPVIEKLLWVVVVIAPVASTFSFSIFLLFVCIPKIFYCVYKGSHSITFTLYFPCNENCFSFFYWRDLPSFWDILCWCYSTTLLFSIKRFALCSSRPEIVSSRDFGGN